MPGDVEAELKFVLSEQEIAALESAPALAELSVGEPKVAELVSTYFDTPDRRLRAADCTVRTRRKNGAYVQTAKIGAIGGSGLSSRIELEVPAEDGTPDLGRFDGEAAERLRDLVDGAPLERLFTVTVDRKLRTLVGRDGAEVEFAIDRGAVAADGRSAPVVEAEFELKSGDLRALFQVARSVMTAVPVRFSSISKSERGFRLIDGGRTEDGDAGLPATAPMHAVEAELRPDMTVEQAMQAILRGAFEQIVANVGAVLASDDPEGPHQLRVGLRRLRSAMTLFKPVVDAASAARIKDDLRGLGRSVGDLRDLDVLVDEIVKPCRDHIDAEGLLQVLAERRATVKAKLAAELAGPAVGAVLIDLAAYVEGRGWLSSSDLEQTARLSRPVGAYAEQAIHKRWRKVAAMGRNAEALTPEERHELRKGFKKLRYALDFFGGVIAGKDQRRLMKDVKAALKVLGYLNDVATAEGMAKLVSGSAAIRKRKDYPAIERAIGFCLGWHGSEAHRAWSEHLGEVSLKKTLY